MNRALSSGLASICLAVAACSGCGKQPAKPATPPPPAASFKPQEMADALHAVIAADNQEHIRLIVEQFPEGDARGQALLAIHARALRQASASIQQQGAEFHYVLRSLWPINPKNAPETATERAGLQYVLDHPGTNYYAEESLGGRRYFVGVYPQAAWTQTCADCHNQNAASPKKDFRTGQVMGGLIVRVPLEF